MREVLARLVGRTLESVTEARHWREGMPGDGDEALIDFWLYFQGCPAAHVCGDDSGTRLLITFDDPYASYEMGPYGEFRVEPVLPTSPLAPIVGRRLVAADTIGPETGVLLRFDERELAIIASDDDFEFATEPADIAAVLDMY
jgi:hypothetical protein